MKAKAANESELIYKHLLYQKEKRKEAKEIIRQKKAAWLKKRRNNS